MRSYHEMPEQFLEDNESLCSTPIDSLSITSDTTSQSEDMVIEGKHRSHINLVSSVKHGH